MTDQITEVEGLHKPDHGVIDELRKLLAQAESGELRGFIFAAHHHGSGVHSFGSQGTYDLADFALGIKLLEFQFTALCMGSSERER